MQPSRRAAAGLFRLVFFSISLVSILVMASDTQPTSAFQAYILLQFKQAITKDPQEVLRSWHNESSGSLTPHFCNWTGIKCDSPQHRFVVSIALARRQLEGSIAPLVGNLTSLVSIDLSYNSLSGFVPSDLGLLSNLKTLKLSSNMFVGNISTSLSNCSSLTLLDVSNNFLSGGIPRQLGVLPSLQGLFLSYNFLDGPLPPSLFNASALKFLDISHNCIAGLIPASIAGNSSLLSLKLAANNLTGPIPDTLRELGFLQGLDVSDNKLNGTIPSQLAALQFLGTVILCGNLLTGQIPASFSKMQQSLRVLRLSNNLLSGAIPFSLGNCTFLEDLDLSHNRLDGGIPTSVASLYNLLIGFDLSHNSLTGPIPPGMGGMVQVLYIDLSHNKLSGTIPDKISSCVGLEYLDLSNNQLRGPAPHGLGSLHSLTMMLDLSHNLIEGSIPDLEGLNNLRIMDLSHNELSGSIPDLHHLNNLRKMNLSHNNLSGSVPSSLSRLQRLVVFNLSFNRLSGCFPTLATPISKNISSSWIQGNPDLCVPFLRDFCSSDACASVTQLTWHAHLVLFVRVLSSTGVVIWVGIGSYFFLAKLLRSSSHTTSQDQTALVLSILKGFTVYSAAHLSKGIHCLDSCSIIGSGASSDVYKVQFGNGQVCALKCFKPTAREQLFNTELEVLTNLRHRNLVPIRGFCKQGTTRAILLDYMENGSLKTQLYDVPSCTLDLERRITIVRDVAEGLLYLHNYCHCPIIHCDLKPANILLDKKYKAHIADFGLATYAKGGLTNAKRRGQPMLSSTLLRLPGTVGYIAPEYAAFKTTPSKAADIYSYGVVVLELLTRRQPGQGDFPPGIYSLPALVRFAMRDNNLESVLDADLKLQMRTRLLHDKVFLLASIGLACADEDPSARPPLHQVVSSLKYHHTFQEQNLECSCEDQVANGDVAVDADVVVVNVDNAVEVVPNVDAGVESEVADGVLVLYPAGTLLFIPIQGMNEPSFSTTKSHCYQS